MHFLVVKLETLLCGECCDTPILLTPVTGKHTYQTCSRCHIKIKVFKVLVTHYRHYGNYFPLALLLKHNCDYKLKHDLWDFALTGKA